MEKSNGIERAVSNVLDEKRIDYLRIQISPTLNNRDNYQKRALAFLGERILSFWVFLQKHSWFKIKEVETDFRPELKPATATDNRGQY